MRQFIFGFIAALTLIAGGSLGYVALGLAPVATASKPLPFERLIAGMALNARVDKEAPKSSPISASDEVYTAGARIYRNNCAVCHGLPGRDQTAIAKGEFPKPPELFKGKGVTDDPAGVTYWKVANGIRLSGMPGVQRFTEQRGDVAGQPPSVECRQITGHRPDRPTRAPSAVAADGTESPAAWLRGSRGCK